MQINYFDGQKICDCTKDDTVYHYTSPESFLPIIVDKQFWFSDAQYMNDKSEYVYIKKIYEEAKKGTSRENDKQDYDFLVDYDPYTNIRIKFGKNRIFKAVFTRYYMLCTSIDRDNHSVWNNYVKNDQYQGYNIGLSVNGLVKSIDNPAWNITHGLVNYDEDAQTRQIHEKILELDKEFANDDKKRFVRDERGDIIEDRYNNELIPFLMIHSKFYKNPAFKHENEYRFVIDAPFNSSDKDNNYTVQHHVGKNGLIVPHLQIYFDPIEVIQSVNLSPMMEQGIAEKGIRSLLSSKIKDDTNKIKINFSQIDLRF